MGFLLIRNLSRFFQELMSSPSMSMSKLFNSTITPVMCPFRVCVDALLGHAYASLELSLALLHKLLVG